MVDHEIHEQSKEHRITTVRQMRKSISDSDATGSQETWGGLLKLRTHSTIQQRIIPFLLSWGGGGGCLVLATIDFCRDLTLLIQ